MSVMQIFDLIDEIAFEVSSLLRKNIGKEISQLGISRGTTSDDAWKLLQRASLFEKQFISNTHKDRIEMTKRDFEIVDSLYSLVEQNDEQWVEPIIRRGWLAYRQSRLFNGETLLAEHLLQEGLKHADKALDLEPKNPDALELKATLLYWSWLSNYAENRAAVFNEAEQLFNESIKYNPKQASALNSLSHLYLNKGWASEAKQAAQTAYSIDPYLMNIERTIWRLLTISFDMGNTQETKRWCKEGLQRFPNYFRFHEGMIMLNTMPGVEPNIDETWKSYQSFIEVCPANDSSYYSKYCLQLVAMALAKANLHDSARVVSLKGKASIEEDPSRDVTFLESIVHLWIDDIDEAIRLIGLFFSANPGLAEGYQDPYRNKDLFWYQSGFYENPRFEALIGLN
jgi:tetratricopeptide (TPR) repeat protein